MEDSPESWDRAETLGKVRARPEDVITKEKYRDHGIIYSKEGRFPILDTDGQPPAGLDSLEWQTNPQHGLVIRGETHLIQAFKRVGSEHLKTFQDANKEVQGRTNKPSKARVWTARTALFLIRLFATVIG